MDAQIEKEEQEDKDDFEDEDLEFDDDTAADLGEEEVDGGPVEEANISLKEGDEEEDIDEKLNELSQMGDEHHDD